MTLIILCVAAGAANLRHVRVPIPSRPAMSFVRTESSPKSRLAFLLRILYTLMYPCFNVITHYCLKQ
jgi:hypothetical protein